jgi:hypothetical protein
MRSGGELDANERSLPKLRHGNERAKVGATTSGLWIERRAPDYISRQSEAARHHICFRLGEQRLEASNRVTVERSSAKFRLTLS